ncbi:MAG: TIGR01777 family oxidoreductase [Myxococcales bacterium]|nr:TIGR01777 family oxidoreductase [Myxococcales bacterium]
MAVEPKTVGITGASGFLGTALTTFLRDQGCEVRAFVRPGGDRRPGDVPWDPRAGALDAADLADIDAIVHLAGESVVGRWSHEKKRRILESRRQGTELLARTIAALPGSKPDLLSASAIGFYPDVGDQTLDETAPVGTDFLSEVCRVWEASTESAREAGARVVRMRVGLVLAPDGGALRNMLPSFRAGLGARIGSGTQYMSWISKDDFLAAVAFLLDHPEIHGPVNLTAPTPVTNADFTDALGKALGRPTFLVAPVPILRCALGEFSTELLASHRILPKVLMDSGFQFEHTTVTHALDHLLAS